LIVERTQAGLKAAKNLGVKLGRKPSLSEDQCKHVRELLAKGESPAAIAKLLNVCRTTIYNSMKE
jgi:DNA invertase Pin-like site-specific DNA recombinase